jgi:hypothetical protein
MVAMFRGSRDQVGLWIVPTGEGEARKLLDGVVVPLAWEGNRAIHVVRDPVAGMQATRIERVALSGGAARVALELPFACDISGLSLSHDAGRAVCAVREGVSDVWVVDGLTLRLDGRRER